jgi:uncharacterized repeat protein (TIGR01451 family)
MALLVGPIQAANALQIAGTPQRYPAVNPALRPVAHVITVAPLPPPRPVLCVGYSQVLTASGGLPPYVFSLDAGALPSGLTLTSEGLLQGVATAAEASAFTLKVVDSSGVAARFDCVLPVSVGYRAPDDQVELSIPPIGSGGSGIPAEDTTTSALTVGGVSAAVAVLGVDVHVTLVHERDGDLVLSLVTPDGVRIPLASQLGDSGASYLGTVFSDRASSPICDAAAPFNGTFRPERPIGMRNANGTWTLEIEDRVNGSTGRLLDWSIELLTASTGATGYGGLAKIWWYSVPGLSVGQGVATDATHIFVTAGTEVSRIFGVWPLDASNWTRTILPGLVLMKPLFVPFASGVLVVNGSDGSVYGLDPSDGTPFWVRSTRRATCSTDTLTAAPVAQLWRESDCAFRSAIPGDGLIFVGTDYQCSTHGANRVYGLRGGNGAIQWTFNATGAYHMDRVTALTVDVSRNRVYVVTDRDPGASAQDTVWLLNSITGAKLANRDVGAIDVRPVLGDRGLYVLSREGTAYRLDPDTLVVQWSLPLGAGAPFDRDMAFDPLHNVLVVVDSDGVLHAVSDDGDSASNPWNLAHVPYSASEFGGVAVAPFLGNVYAATTGTYVGGSDDFLVFVYQIDVLTGTLESWASLTSETPGGVPIEVELEPTIGEGRAEARLTLLTVNSVERAAIPWSGFYNHSGSCCAPDSPSYPSCDLGLQGSTLPASPSVGQTVTDTLSVLNHGNRAPRCAEVRAMLPEGMSFLGATISQGTIGLEGDEIVARLGTVPISPAIAIEVSLRLDVAGSFPRTYTVSSPDYPDPSPANDTLLLSN